MAQRQTEFAYHNIELYKSESLGSGSYGGVCKAKCDGLLCAAKIMHPTLFDPRDPGTESYHRKFREECHLLSLARHPNVVQYLATYYDPDTRLPVLLMELCDESLTAFLERSPGPLSYHIQFNICHDITLALVYIPTLQWSHPQRPDRKQCSDDCWHSSQDHRFRDVQTSHCQSSHDSIDSLPR